MAISKILHQLVIILLVFSQLLISLNAASTSRAGSELFHGGQLVSSTPFENTYQQRMRKLGNGRKDIEINDYSESGPNKGHTPDPPAAGRN